MCFFSSDDKFTSSECVKILTSENIDSYTIHDVIMPLPGYDVTYPQHAARAWYEELLSHDGIDIDNMRHKVKDYSLSGAYRYVQIYLPNDTKVGTIIGYSNLRISPNSTELLLFTQALHYVVLFSSPFLFLPLAPSMNEVHLS